MAWKQDLTDETGMHMAMAMAQLSASERQLLDRSRAYARAIDAVLGAYQELAVVAGERERARALVGLRAVLFADRLQIVTGTDLTSGEYQYAQVARLSRAQRALLASVPMAGGTLADTVDAWSEVVQELAEVAACRVALRDQAARSGHGRARAGDNSRVTAEEKEPGARSPGDYPSVRARWVELGNLAPAARR